MMFAWVVLPPDGKIVTKRYGIMFGLQRWEAIANAVGKHEWRLMGRSDRDTRKEWRRMRRLGFRAIKVRVEVAE